MGDERLHPTGGNYEVRRRDFERVHVERTLGSNEEDANRTKGSHGNDPGDNEERPDLRQVAVGNRRQALG